MPWLYPVISERICALFAPRPLSEAALEEEIEDIQTSMLEVISDVGDSASARMVRRIEGAVDIAALWYLRSDLMAIVARRHGEAAAREILESITDMFENMLPHGLKSRPSPLT